MTEVVEANGLSIVAKKSRKNRAPVPLYRRESVGSTTNNASSSVSEAANETKNQSPASRGSPEQQHQQMNEVVKISRMSPLNGQGGQQHQQQPAIKSYSDFMRSLAAKYNNNE